LQNGFEFTYIKGPLKKMATGFRGFETFKMLQKGIEKLSLIIARGSESLLFGVGGSLGVRPCHGVCRI
jgi:hypothetical protein